jgi:histone deacetylase 6
MADPSLWQAGVTEKTFEARVMELVTYIWDNFIQLLDNDEDIFIMGVGNAYVGIKALLTTRGMFITCSFLKTCY